MVADTLDFSDAWQHHVGLTSSLKEMHHTGPHTPAILCFITHKKLEAGQRNGSQLSRGGGKGAAACASSGLQCFPGAAHLAER